jgi:hypothetical protein
LGCNDNRTTACNLSLRKLGAVAAGEAPDANEQSDALAALNQLIESWNLQGLTLYRLENASYTLVPSQQTYTIGSGADFDGARPITLKRLCDAGRNRLPAGAAHTSAVERDSAEIAGVPTARGRLLRADVSRRNAAILACSLEALTVTLSVNMQISPVASIGATIALPPGYERALVYALAVDLAPEYPAVTLSQRVIDTADEALADIKRANNTQNQAATFDIALAGGCGGSLAAFIAGILTGENPARRRHRKP